MRDIPESQIACPIDFVICVLGSKWSIPILRDLFQGHRRTSELMRSLVGISPRTLSERLRELEERGLLSRTVYAEIPPRVEYELTETGRELHGVMLAMEKLGQRWQASMPSKSADAAHPCTHCGKSSDSLSCAALEAFADGAADDNRKSRQLVNKKRK